MDNVIADVVGETATKVTLDKKFFLGALVGATVVGTVVVGKKVVDHFRKDSDITVIDEVE